MGVISRSTNLCFNVPPGEFLEGSLVDEVNDGLWCSTLVLDVACPALDLVRVPQDLFLVWKVLLLLKETEILWNEWQPLPW